MPSKNKTSSPNCLVLFSSYFTEEDIPRYVQDYLIKLKPFSKKIIFLTQDDRMLSQQSTAFLTSIGATLQYVPNEGMDFGMWSKAIIPKHFTPCSRLLLANDSCIAVKPFDDFFSIAEQLPHDVVSATESWQIKYHLQSFFVYAKTPKAAQTILDFLARKQSLLQSNPTYSDVVKICELGLSETLQENNLQITGIWSSKNPENKTNPTFLYGFELIRYGMPLLKKKFLRGTSKATFKEQIYNKLDHKVERALKKLTKQGGINIERTAELESWLQESAKQLSKYKLRLLFWQVVTFLGFKQHKKLKCHFEKIPQVPEE